MSLTFGLLFGGRVNLVSILENICNHLLSLFSIILFLLALAPYIRRIDAIDTDRYFIANDGMKAGKNVF